MKRDDVDLYMARRLVAAMELAECAYQLAEEFYPYLDEYTRKKWNYDNEFHRMRDLRREYLIRNQN